MGQSRNSLHLGGYADATATRRGGGAIRVVRGEDRSVARELCLHMSHRGDGVWVQHGARVHLAAWARGRACAREQLHPPPTQRWCGQGDGRAGGMASAWASRTSTNWLLQNTYNTDMKLPAHTQREAGGRDHGGVGRLLTAGRLGAPLPIYLPLTRTRHEETNQGREGHEAGGSVSLMGNFDSRARNIDGVLRHGQSPL